VIGKLQGLNEDDRRGMDSEVASLKEKNERLAEKVSTLQADFDNLFRKLEERREAEGGAAGGGAATSGGVSTTAAPPKPKGN
jgi:molecular chaperone GrpE (heat shock protein)